MKIISYLISGKACGLFCIKLALVVACAAGVAAVHAKTITIAYAGVAGSPAENGVRQGIIEANLQGEFLGVSYQLVANEDAVKPAAIVIADSDDKVVATARKYPDTPVFNIQSNSDALRAMCLPNLFHTAPSQQMLSDALTQWRTKNPDSAAKPQAWHRKFRKYAAAQLNIRYHESFGEDMNDDAWAGWAATKLLSDTLIRAPELMNDALIQELKTNVAFDGQKGIDMAFRETGQLAQPLLLVDGDEIKGEAPVRGVVEITNLDSLGELNCPK